jgi:hypothetical protein
MKAPVLILILALQSACAAPTVADSIFSTEELALIETVFFPNAKGATHLDASVVLKNRTTLEPLFVHQSFAEFSQELRTQAREETTELESAVVDLLQKNAKEVKFSLPTQQFPHVKMFSPTTIKNYDSTGENRALNFWDLYYDQFPFTGGLHEISRPGISTQKTVAILYIGVVRGGLNGSGRLVIFKKEGGRWVQQAKSIGNYWIS